MCCLVTKYKLVLNWQALGDQLMIALTGGLGKIVDIQSSNSQICFLLETLPWDPWLTPIWSWVRGQSRSIICSFEFKKQDRKCLFLFFSFLFFLSSRQALSKVKEMESEKGSHTTISAKLQMIGLSKVSGIEIVHASQPTG